MYKKLLLRLVSICAALGLVSMLSGCDLQLSQLSRITQSGFDMSEPDYPLIEWDPDDEAKSMDELTGYISDLVPKVAIEGTRELEIEDICRFCFWVEGFSVTEATGTQLRVYTLHYTDDASKHKSRLTEIDREAEDILSRVPEGADQWQTMLTVHDELIKRITYTEESEGGIHVYDIYGALVDHKAVCQGYTYAFSYIMHKADIPCGEVYSEDHVWNIMPSLTSGEKYIDVTWDDTDEKDRNGNAYILYDCFCLTGREMESLGRHVPLDGNVDDRQSTGDNYFRCTDNYISPDDTEIVPELIRAAIDSGNNTIQLRFEESADYQNASASIREYLREAGYSDSDIMWKSRLPDTLEIGLYPPEDYTPSDRQK